MTLQDKKDVAVRTLRALIGGDLKTAFSACSDDVVWRIPGNLPGVSGDKRGKQAIRDFMAGMAGVFPEGVTPEIKGVYADGDTVVLEVVNRARTNRGRRYENDYCFVFEFAGDAIRSIREYLDTQRAKEILLD